MSAELKRSCTAAISDFACLKKSIIKNSVSTCFKAKQQLSNLGFCQFLRTAASMKDTTHVGIHLSFNLVRRSKKGDLNSIGVGTISITLASPFGDVDVVRSAWAR